MPADIIQVFPIPAGITEVVIPVVTLLAGALVGYLLSALRNRKEVASAEGELKAAQTQARAIVSEAKASAKEELLKMRDDFEKSTKDTRREVQKLEGRIANRESNLDRKSDMLEDRSRELEKREDSLRASQDRLASRNTELDELVGKQVTELERVASLTRDEARDQLLSCLEETLEADRAALIRRYQEESRQKVMEEGQEIMVTAMQRYAGDCTYERTTSTIPLPSDEMKGRIIGREGRNIRAIEAATGVSILIDDTPEAVVISCFDPVRREIARRVMESLISDGRIHPSRIEEMVGKMTKELDSEIQKAGQAAIDKVGVTRLRGNVIKLIGRLKYRYSFSQNVLMHSMEVASLMGIIAAQIGLDERKAKRAGLLHDIGKAVDHEIEGPHAAIGADLLKRAGEDGEVVNAVAAHHEDVAKGSLMAVLVEICDKLSAGRPGARSETTELYLRRLEDLEAIGGSFRGVEQCYAIQAGRELRVIVKPGEIDEDQATTLAHEMADRIEKEMRYPGQIKVSVIRETRFTEYAK
ncbi:MAG: ribonuclease Y [Victivallales bacterium]|jgi:ribonucrease Y|nr:ribonuclease Y [Victivallales bacterium]MBT7301038.1 ribonuclease Y [Victivallales bacterium]